MSNVIALFSDYTFQTVALGSALIGVISGVLGSFAVLRKQSLLGDGVSHSALPGVVMAFILSGNKNTEILLLGALISGVLATLFIISIVRHTRIKFDSALALVMSVFFGEAHFRDSAKVIILLSIAFLLVALEKILGDTVPFSGLLAVMAMGLAILQFNPAVASRMSDKFSKLWVVAEILLFALVGSTVDISLAFSSGGRVVVLLLLALLFRMAGVFFCLLQSKLNMKESLFCMIAYIPKATVQAAIGGIPLAMGLSCGDIVLTVAVLSILTTAPLGALGVDLTYNKWLSPETEQL